MWWVTWTWWVKIKQLQIVKSQNNQIPRFAIVSRDFHSEKENSPRTRQPPHLAGNAPPKISNFQKSFTLTFYIPHSPRSTQFGSVDTVQIFVVARCCNIHRWLHNVAHGVQWLNNHDNNEFLSFSRCGDVFRHDGCVTGSPCSCPSGYLYICSNPGIVRYDDDFFFQWDTKLSGTLSFHLARVHLCLITKTIFFS